MEILSYVITGKLAHKDSMGEQHDLGPNEVQAMSAGTGVIHSEFNGVNDAETHFLQIWIVPNAKGLTPSYQQFEYAEAEKRGVLRLMAGPDRGTTPPAAFIHQDARMYASVLGEGQALELPVAAGRFAWVHCVQGAIDVNGVAMRGGDGLAVSEERSLQIRGGAGGGELLLFDLA
jgi:redox-sensitive bicupin YhaK (pirin superfamily)